MNHNGGQNIEHDLIGVLNCTKASQPFFISISQWLNFLAPPENNKKQKVSTFLIGKDKIITLIPTQTKAGSDDPNKSVGIHWQVTTV